jgi:hypothetical protein
MKYLIFLAIGFFGVVSCISQRRKDEYGRKRIMELKQYSVSDTFRFAAATGEFMRKDITKLKKRDLIVLMDRLEYLVALYPDSTHTNNGSIDSFYNHPAKINYIRRNRIVRPGIHCL